MKRIIRRFAIVSLAIFGLALSPLCRAAFAAEPQVIDGIAAIVNGDTITYSEVRAVSTPREKLLRSQYAGDELVNKIKETRQAALQDLIDRQLIIQAFKKESYQVPDHYVEERLHEIIQESFGGDRNTFIKTLEAQNYTVEEYYKAHRDEFTSKEEIKLRMIMIPRHAESSNSAAQKAMVEEVLGKLAGGAEFDRIAQVYSEDSTRDQGGDWGWIERKTLAAPLERVAFNLPIGRISSIVEFSGNYYILKVDEKRGGKTRSLAEVRPEIEKQLIQLEAQHLQERWLASLRSKAYIRTF